MDDIPSKALDICREIDQKFEHYSRGYIQLISDLIYTVDGLFELNCRTGIYSEEVIGENANFYVDSIAVKIIEMAEGASQPK